MSENTLKQDYQEVRGKLLDRIKRAEDPGEISVAIQDLERFAGAAATLAKAEHEYWLD